MAWSGGTYRKGNYSTNGWTGDASLGIGIEAGRHDTQDDDFQGGINQCLNKDGSNAATSNLNIGSNRLTNVAAATARTDAAQVGQVQDGDYIWLGTTAGTAIAQTASATPAITAYKAGQKFRMKIGAGLGSTGSSPTLHTLSVNGLAAITIQSQWVASPTIGTWVPGVIMEVVYDGTYFQILNDTSGWLSHSITITPGAGTATGVTITNNFFKKTGQIVTIDYTGYYTASAATNFSQFSLPVRPNEIFSSMVGTYFSNATTQVAFAQTASPRSVNRVNLSTYNSANLTAGTVYFCVGGSYKSE
jgi:hypothetical protein